MDYRHEQKYICTGGQMVILEARMKGVLKADPHVPPSDGMGSYRVRSVYFDDDADHYLDENLSGVDDRAKFRIRLYNGSTDFIRLEIKYKRNGLTSKESCKLTKEQTRSILAGRCPSITQDSPPPLRFLYAEMNANHLRPKVIVEYRRTALLARDGNVRITFDRQIGCSDSVQRFLDEQVPLLPVFPEGQGVLEVKYDAFLPDWVGMPLDTGYLPQATVSKYALSRLLLRGEPLYRSF